MSIRNLLLSCGALVLTTAIGYGGYQVWWHFNYYDEEHTDYTNPPVDDDTLNLSDDLLADKQPAFDPLLVDSRPLGEWELNASGAVIQLDCPLLKPDQDAEALALRPSYAAACAAASDAGWTFLPSANLLDGAAKQFDDGLMAAIELAASRGELPGVPSVVELIAELFEQSPPGSSSRSFLAAALELGGRPVDLSPAERAATDQWLREFRGDPLRSRPISFYDWNDDLRQWWQVSKFLQQTFAAAEFDIPQQIAAVLETNPPLLDSYRAVVEFQSRMTNPMAVASIDTLIPGGGDPTRGQHVALFPPSTSREGELFKKLFPKGTPAGTNLMSELILQVRAGTVDLAPRADDGWYQHQVHALETLVDPSRGQQAQKLLLTVRYKKRLIEAFQALLTKRRETHARGLMFATAEAAALGAGEVRPRLRIEPCATFYLRTARAYAFIDGVLQAAAGEEILANVHGLRRSGPREKSLGAELADLQQRFYGFYLVSCEDLGMRPEFAADEPVDVAAAKAAALAWLADYQTDRDLAQDTRVAVPIYADPLRNTHRIWATLGVRLTKLDAEYARPPRIRPAQEGGVWQDTRPRQLGESHYVIAVDEFAEVERSGLQPPTRDELRAICDRHQTKAAITAALATGA